MKLKDLKIAIDSLIEANPHNSELEVVIPNNKPSIGAESATKVHMAYNGFDWDGHLFFILPVNKTCFNLMKILETSEKSDFGGMKLVIISNY